MPTAIQLLAPLAASALAPAPAPDCAAWIEDNAPLPASGLSAERAGPYRFESVPYLRGIARAWDDPAVRGIDVLKSAQLGWSDFVIRAALYDAVNGRSTLFYQPDDTLAREFGAQRIRPAVLASPACLAATNGRPRDLKTTTIEFARGLLLVLSAQGETSTLSRPAPRVVADEYPHFPLGFATEARSRLQTFADRKLVRGGTPVDEGGLDADYEERSDRREFWVPCPHTGRFFELYNFELLRWDPDRPDGSHFDADPDRLRRPGEVWVLPPHARHLPKAEQRAYRIDERHKAWMVRHGVWVRHGEAVEPREGLSHADVLDWLHEEDNPDLSTIDERTLRQATGRDRLPRVLTHASADTVAASGREKGHAGRRAEPERGVAAGLARPPTAPTSRPEGVTQAATPIRIVGDAVNGASETAGFRLSALVSLIGVSWGEIAAEFVETRGEDPGFWRDRFGQAWSRPGEVVDDVDRLCVPVVAGGYRVGEAPAWATVPRLVVDVQQDCLYASLYASDPTITHRCLVRCTRIPRDPDANLTDVDEELLAATLETVTGKKEPVRLFGIDHGHYSSDVEALAARLEARGRRVVLVKGDGTPDRYWTVKEGKTASGRPLLRCNANTLKDTAHVLLRPPLRGETPSEPGDRVPRTWLPENLPHWVRRQLTAEHRVRTTDSRRPRPLVRSGIPVSKWERRKGRRDNHAWDCDYYDLGLLAFLGDSLRARLAPPTPPTTPTEDTDPATEDTDTTPTPASGPPPRAGRSEPRGGGGPAGLQGGGVGGEGSERVAAALERARSLLRRD